MFVLRAGEGVEGGEVRAGLQVEVFTCPIIFCSLALAAKSSAAWNAAPAVREAASLSAAATEPNRKGPAAPLPPTRLPAVMSSCAIAGTGSLPSVSAPY